MRVLVFGIDGGTWDLLRPAMEDGYMPFLASAVRSGASGILESTCPPLTPVAWGTFQTGANPGRTGVVDFLNWAPGARPQTYVSSRDLPVTVWEVLGDAGLRVGVLNCPMTYPPRPINGFIVAGLETPSRASPFVHPPHLKDALLRAVPDYPILEAGILTAERSSPARRWSQILGSMCRVIALRGQAARFLLREMDPDVFMVHFQAVDELQHVVWGLIDPASSGFDRGVREAVFDQFFRQLDAQMEQVAADFHAQRSERATILFASDHGFQLHRQRFFLTNWLAESGLGDPLTAREHAMWQRLKTLAARVDVFNLRLRLLSREARRHLRTRFRAWFAHHSPNPAAASEAVPRAYCISKHGWGLVYVTGRDPAARLDCARNLRETLAGLEVPGHDGPIFRRVWLRDELYVGARVHQMPDVIAEPQAGITCDRDPQPAGAPLLQKVSPLDYYPSGVHHPDGVFIWSGEGIRPQGQLQARIADICPTLIACCPGAARPATVDGRVMTEAFQAGWLQAPSSRSAPSTRDAQSPDPVYSVEEEHLLEKRLRDLGYL